MPGPPRLSDPALRPLALQPHLPHPAQPARPTPPLLPSGLPSRRAPQAPHVINAACGSCRCAQELAASTRPPLSTFAEHIWALSASAIITGLLPGGAPRQLDADTAARLLSTVRPRATGPATLRRLAAELIAEVRHLDRRIATASTQISDAVAASGTTLTQLRGIGDLTAGKIIGRVGDITRFRSPAAFASYTGTAPIEVSSGDVVRHRLSRGRRSPAQLLPPRRGHHPAETRRLRTGLLPAQTRLRGRPQGSPAVFETTPIRCGLPSTPPRCPSLASGEPERTAGGDYELPRGWLNP
jgi:hypothetical protein